MSTEMRAADVAAEPAGPAAPVPRPGRIAGRPELYTSYRADMALLNTPAKRRSVVVLLVLAVVLPLVLGDGLLIVLATAFGFAVGAIGLNLLTGYAGQISLGHAVFVGLGAYTAAVLSGNPEARTTGFDLPMFVWLPAAALVPAVLGAIVAPIAARLRGLYLAIITLGLVFLGEHVFRQGSNLTGPVGQGRSGVVAEVFGVSLVTGDDMLTRAQKSYWFCLVLLVVAALLGRNLARSAVGRAFSAVRDRDIAAAVIGVPLTRYKLIAFVVSSAFAGIAGAMLYTISRNIDPNSFNLLMSVRFIAIVLIGGVATISGSILGALFITALPSFTRWVSSYVTVIPPPGTSSGILNTAEFEAILYGLLIIVFLIFEPRGLYGIWIRIRNYWKGWPFTY